MKNLSELSPHQEATICEVTGEQDFVCRMYELGLFPGKKVIVEHKAPFAGPLSLVAGEFRFFMRRADARHIFCV